MKTFSKFIGPVLVALAVTTNGFSHELGSNQKPIAFGADQVIVDFENVTWEPLEVEGLDKGAQIAVIRGDLNKGGSEVMIKTPAGYKVAMHSHTSDETYVWLKGAYTLISEKGEKHEFLGPSFISFPGNAPPHAMTCDAEDYCLFYIRYSRPFDVVYGDRRVSTGKKKSN